MIDRPDQVGRLLERLGAALPIPAQVTPELQVTLQERNGITVPAACNVTWVSYAGDEGGIICQLDAGAGTSAVFTSLTHLKFDPRLPLARDILTYQKHRVKRLRRQPQQGRAGISAQSQAGSAVVPPRRLPVNDKAFMNGRAAMVTAASATSLTIMVPVGASGHVTVETPNGTATSSAILAVPPLPYMAANVGSVVQATLGSPVVLSRGGASQVALAVFDATAGQRAALQVTASTLGGGNLALYGPDGAQVSLTSLDNGAFADAAPLALTGAYTLVAAPSGTTGGRSPQP